jgi:hypothetical protein
MPQTTDQDRAAFEAWFEPDEHNRKALSQWWHAEDGNYYDAPYLNGCWQGWKAARAVPLVAEAPKKLWLWKNFVDGRPEYWAFDNPYPRNMDDGDPQTLGQPCGYALFKPSRDGSCGRTEEQVLREMASVSRVAPPASPAEAPREPLCFISSKQLPQLATRSSMYLPYSLCLVGNFDTPLYAALPASLAPMPEEPPQPASLSDEAADEILRGSEWTKWSDARDMIQSVYAKGRKSVSHLRTAPRPTLSDDLEEMRARKDAAYEERNKVVAALARLFPSGIAKTAIEGWSDDWHGCVYIDLPTGQVSWHFHDSQAHLFAGLPPYTGNWDGHDTPEKYRRLALLAASASPQQPEQKTGSFQEREPRE